MFGLTEASTRRRAVCVGLPITASAGSILAGESFMLRAKSAEHSRPASADGAGERAAPLRGSRRVVRRVIKARPPHLRTGRDLRAHRDPLARRPRIAAAETLWKICVPLVSFRRRQTFLEAGFPTASRSRALSTRPFVFSFA